MFSHHYILLQRIANSMEMILIRNPNVSNDPRYFLFQIIKENFAGNIAFLSQYDFRQDRLKFIAFRRNLRISFEAFLDLINLGHDFNMNRYQNKDYEGSYLSVLYYNHTQDKHEKSKTLIREGYLGVKPYNGKYTIKSKTDIFRQTYHSIKTPEGIDVAEYVSKICNEVLHPDIFMQNPDTHEEIRKMLDMILRIDLMLFYKSYEEICTVLNNKQYIRCNMNCPSPCSTCMNQSYENSRRAIEHIVQHICIFLD